MIYYTYVINDHISRVQLNTDAHLYNKFTDTQNYMGGEIGKKIDPVPRLVGETIQLVV